jgi:tetratricopeptide (TPR) repeat protein
MGIGVGALQVLLKEAARKTFRGASLLTLGRQDIFFSYPTLLQTAAEYAVPLVEPPAMVPPPKTEFAAQGYMSDDSLFAAFGFSESKAMDYSPYEGAQVLFDLNRNDLPQSLTGAFDVIIDGGTIEHIFHIPNALNNIFKLLRIGGRVIHLVPTNNLVDHGFYMFSPTLFWDYYQTNGFDLHTLLLVRHHPPYLTLNPGNVWDYTPGCLEKSSQGGLDSAMYQTICIATKRAKSTGDRIPQQGSYAKKDWIESRDLHQNLEAAGRALECGDLDSAFSRSLQVIQKFPENPAAWLLKARTLRAQRRFPEAISALEQSLRLEKSPEALSELAQLCNSFGLRREAGEVARYLEPEGIG